MLILKNIKNFYSVLCLSFLVISLALSNEKISANDKNKWELLEIKNVDEIFLTGSAVEVTPVGKIDDITYKVGEITSKISNLYMKEVDPNYQDS